MTTNVMYIMLKTAKKRKSTQIRIFREESGGASFLIPVCRSSLGACILKISRDVRVTALEVLKVIPFLRKV